MMERKEEDFRKYYEIIGKPIGKGGFGTVYKAKEIERNEDRAIKVIDKNEIRTQFYKFNLYDMTEEDMKPYIDSFKNEIKLMEIMEGKNKENINTVKYYEYFNTENEFAIVMELCDNNLTQLFEKTKKDEGLNIDEIYNILTQLNNSFKIMNENKIGHRDLKLENILIKYENKNNKNKYIVKLTDYGISKQLMNKTHFTTKIGTLQYEAPEILEDIKNYNEKCDLWSLGVIIYRLCFKKFPYNGETEIAILNSLKNGQKLLKKTDNKELNDLILKLLVINPKERMNWNEYFNHSFLKNRNNNQINMILKIDKEDISKKIYFLDNDSWVEEKKIYHDYHNNLSELNETNVELYINDKEKKFKKYFVPKAEGLFTIKLIFKIDIIDCSFMFYDCKNITSLDLSSFDTKKVKAMTNMFYGCEKIVSLDLSSFNTKNVTDMSGMFYGCENIININLSTFNTKNVTNMNSMFSGCSNLKNLDLSTFDTKNVIGMNGMFSGCFNLKNLNISSFNTENVTDMNRMFSVCSNLESLDLSSFDTKNVTSISGMFSGCSNLSNLDLSSFDTKNIDNMGFIFSGCSNLKSLDLSSFDTKKVNNMNSMFSACSNIKNLDLSTFDTKNVTDMGFMFSGCSNLTSLDLSSFDTKNVNTIGFMLYDCCNMKLITIQKEMNNVAFEIFKNNKNIKINRF